MAEGTVKWFNDSRITSYNVCYTKLLRPWVAEDAATARDIMLCELTGSRLHVAHVSTKGSVELVRAAKKRGVPRITSYNVCYTKLLRNKTSEENQAIP